MSCLFKVKPKVVINFIFRKFFVFFKRECFILLCRPVLSRKFGGFGPGHKKKSRELFRKVPGLYSASVFAVFIVLCV